MQCFSYRSLRNLTIGVMGIGTIGGCIVKSARNFNMTVWALCRSSASKNKSNELGASKYFSPDEISSFLSGCDYVINALPSTKNTRKSFAISFAWLQV